MTMIVTGGAGFAMAHAVKVWLSGQEGRRAVVFDSIPLDPLVERFWAPERRRIEFVRGDVTKPADWAKLPPNTEYVIHGAAVTPHAGRDTQGVWRRPEAENSARVLQVNIMGAVEALEWAKPLKNLRRFVNVSSGSVYVPEISDMDLSAKPLKEDEFVGPVGLYDISKFSAELITKRYGTLFDLPVVSVRFSTVFGALDRQTPSRNVRSVIERLIIAALRKAPITVRSLDSVADYVSAADIGLAVTAMLAVPPDHLRHDVYNIAGGKLTSLRHLIGIVEDAIGPLNVSVKEDAEADIQQDPRLRTGKYGAYDISRAHEDFSWKPRPLSETIREYADWLTINP